MCVYAMEGLTWLMYRAFPFVAGGFLVSFFYASLARPRERDPLPFA